MLNSISNILYVGVLFSSMRMLVGAISVIYLVTNDVNIIDIGIIKSFQAGIILILDIPLAYLADKKSRKLSVIGAMAFGVLWLITMGLANELYVFYIAEFFNAISLALFSGSFISYLIDKNIELSGKENNDIQKIIGKFHKYQYISMGFSAMIGATFITVESRELWFISGFILLILTIVSFKILPKDVLHKSKESSNIMFSKEISGIFKNLITHTKIKWAVFILIVVMIYYQSIIQFWQIVINSDIDEITTSGYVYGIIFALILFAQSFSGYLAEKLTKKSVILVIFFLTLLLLIYPVFSKINYFYSTIFAIILLFLLVRLIMLMLQSIIHENIESKLRSSYDSVISTIVRLFLLGVLPILGFAINKFGFMPLYSSYLAVSFVVLMLIITIRLKVGSKEL